ncbi:MAG: FemAB family XrtA/PEP-CTERM system-associated protein [Geminicoccaceae bacterium]
MSASPGSDPGVEVVVSGDHDADAWNDYVRKADIDGHFHDFAWRHVIQRSLRHRPHYLIAKQGDAVSGLLPLFEVKSRLFGRSLVSLPFLNGGGLLADAQSSAEALLARVDDMVRDGGYRYGELRQRGPFENYPEKLVCRQHKVAMRLSLGDDPEALFSRFKGKLRSQVRRPKKAGADAQVINGSNVVKRDVEAFYKVFAENMRDLGTPVFPRSLFEETIDGFQERAWLALVWMDDHPAAAGLMVGAGNSIEMIWASSLRYFNRLSVNMLLYWESMRTAILNGYEYFDFGRCSPDSPTYRFKAQWGAEPTPLHWYYVKGNGDIPDVSPDNPKFRAAVRTWQFLPVAVANRLGPLVARSLP